MHVPPLPCSTGLRLIQLLPVNDTGVYGMWWDSYPYSTVSVFALHPLVSCSPCTLLLYWLSTAT